jgi:hypothetical protein
MLIAMSPFGTAGGARQPLRLADAAVAGAAARVVTSQAVPPRGTAVSQLGLQARAPYALESVVAAELRAYARVVAERRADQRAAAASGPAVAPPPSGGAYSYPALENLWVSAGGPRWAASQAASIAECESHGNPQAHNPSGASGLWQILGQVVPGELFDPLVNAENAVAKFRASGDTFAQWVC